MSGTTAARLDPADVAKLPPAERLALLRARMAEVTGRVESNTPVPTSEAIPALAPKDVLAVPGVFGELLPDGGLAHGSLVTWPRGALLCGLLAAVSAQGVMTAVVGGMRPSQVGLLAAYEMGARLDRIALVDADADRAREVLGVLADVRLVVVDVPGEIRMRPTEVKALQARLRSKGAVLVATSGRWVGQPQLGLKVCGSSSNALAQGPGRIRRLEYDVQVTQRGRVYRRGQLTLTGAEGGRTCWSAASSAAAAGRLGMVRIG